MSKLSDTGNSSEMSKWVGTANYRYAERAQQELQRLISGASFDAIVPREVFIMTSPLARQETLRAIIHNEPIFLRHVHPIDAEFTIQTDDGGSEERAEIEGQTKFESHVEIEQLQSFIREEVAARVAGQKVAIQVRIAPDSEYHCSPAALREMAAEALLGAAGMHGFELVVKQADTIISLYVSKTTLYCGISKPAENLSDWAGGAIRFKKEQPHISRAKFKLLEAEVVFGIDFRMYDHALDIGAAPGGWTSLLLERGLQVTAVDPAPLHPSLLQHPHLTYYKKKADEVSFPANTFDLLVCDMNWNPRQTAVLILELINTLTVGGMAIITLKLMHKNAFQALRDMTSALEPHLQLIKAKQLFHNRDEITLCLLRVDE